MTPSAWRDGGRGETIRYVVAESPLGPLLVAATSKGICRLTFDEDESALKRRFPNATILADDGTISAWAAGALTAIEHPAQTPELPIDVRGTAFQEAVWKELRKIPLGETRSYADIAAAVGQPQAVARRRHGQRIEPCRGARALPPRHPIGRISGRLCRRPRSQAEASRGGRRRSAADLGSQTQPRSFCRFCSSSSSRRRAPLLSPLVILSMISRLRRFVLPECGWKAIGAKAAFASAEVARRAEVDGRP